MLPNLISVKDLSFQYSKDSFRLRITQFNLNEAERLFLYGPSGSGKSTFLNLISGLLRADSGELKVLGHDFAQLTNSKRDRVRAASIGCIFQQFNLVPYLSARENILLPAWNSESRRSSSSSVEGEIENLAKRLDILELLDHSPSRLSVGQQQRVAAARALMGPPKIIIADEPTSALDTDRQDAFLDLLLETCQDFKVALLFVSHNRSLAKHFDSSISISELGADS